MGKRETKSELLNYIDIEFLQEFQDYFASSTGVASITVDDNGPITKQSRFTEFCSKYTRGSEEGFKRCNACDINWGKIAAKSSKPVIYKCHSGLTDFAVPIVIEGEHVASILGGQVLTEPPNEEHFRQLAQELGINEDEYIEAVKKIKVVPQETVEASANLLFLVANSISKLAHQKYKLIKSNEQERAFAKREALLRNLTETIRTSLDITETKEKIVKIIGETFGSDRCFLMEYDSKIDKFLKIKYEYISSDDIPTYKGNDVNDDVPNFMQQLKNGKNLIIENKKIFINGEFQSYAHEEHAIEKFKVHSAYAFPFFYKTKLLGALGIHYLKNNHKVTNEEITFMQTISGQMALALHQAELYEITQQNSLRESTLRKIIESLRSSLDLKEVKTRVVKEIGTAFKADRCYFRSYDKIQEKFLKPDVEFLSSNDIPSLLEVEPDQEGLKFFAQEVKRQRRGFYPIIVDKKAAKGTQLENYLNHSDIKVDYAVPIIDRYNEHYWLVLHYSKEYVELPDEDKQLLETIAYQIDIAFEQIKLYSIAKDNALREALLRKIVEKIRGSLDIEEILDFICESVAKLFDVERVAITVFPNEENFEDFILKKEFKKPSSLKGIMDMPNNKTVASFWGHNLIKGNMVLAFSNINDADLPEFFKNAYTTLGTKAMMGTAIKKGEDVWGTLIISKYNETREWSESDKYLLETIAGQVYIAINQAELFEKQKQATEREISLREIIDSIRSILNAKEVKKKFVQEVGKYFNADRCFIYEKTDDNSPRIKAEYVSTSDVKKMSDYDISVIPTEYWDNVMFNKDFRTGTIMEHNEKFISENNLQGSNVEEHLKLFNIKTAIGQPIAYGDEIYGELIIQFTKEYYEITPENLNFIKTLADQAGIALHQSMLYEQIQTQAERERISRNIIEILRSSIDKTIIKKLFVKNIGKFFNADRVFFSEYNPELNIYMPVDKDSEYLSSPIEKSFIGYDWSGPEVAEYIQPMLEKRELNIYSWDEYMQTNQKSQAFIDLFVNSDVKSSYNLPVLYQQKMMGYFCIEFTHSVNKLSSEDIGRIRSICSQAGIALYHADLYLKAQECFFDKNSFASEICEKIKLPTNNIINISTLMYQNEFERNTQIEYLNSIISSCNKLIELTNQLA